MLILFLNAEVQVDPTDWRVDNSQSGCFSLGSVSGDSSFMLQ